ncbi:hypothetical protein [Azospirillum argentinense]|uniref:hypothetical protein n=1 Tax=Azospirillum argentinense TaxID=2970906 RepID=UPI0032E02550
MATILELPAAYPIDGTEPLPIWQGGATCKTSAAALAAYVQGTLTPPAAPSIVTLECPSDQYPNLTSALMAARSASVAPGGTVQVRLAEGEHALPYGQYLADLGGRISLLGAAPTYRVVSGVGHVAKNGENDFVGYLDLDTASGGDTTGIAPGALVSLSGPYFGSTDASRAYWYGCHEVVEVMSPSRLHVRLRSRYNGATLSAFTDLWWSMEAHRTVIRCANDGLSVANGSLSLQDVALVGDPALGWPVNCLVAERGGTISLSGVGLRGFTGTGLCVDGGFATGTVHISSFGADGARVTRSGVALNLTIHSVGNAGRGLLVDEGGVAYVSGTACYNGGYGAVYSRGSRLHLGPLQVNGNAGGSLYGSAAQAFGDSTSYVGSAAASPAANTIGNNNAYFYRA